MFKRETDSTLVITLPLWQVILVLVGLPALDIANSLLPWSTGLLLRTSPFLTIFIAGLLFSLLFLWRRSLVPGVCLHALFDVAAIGFP